MDQTNDSDNPEDYDIVNSDCYDTDLEDGNSCCKLYSFLFNHFQLSKVDLVCIHVYTCRHVHISIDIGIGIYTRSPS